MTLTDLPWTWLAIRGSGITAWLLLTAAVTWGLLLRTRLLGQHGKPMTLLAVHRWITATALAFLAAHLGLLLIDPAVKFTVTQILIPGLAPWQPVAIAAGQIAVWVMIPVTILGRLRVKLGKRGNTWFKKAHLVAYAAWPLATAHYIAAGTDATTNWSLALLTAGTSAVVFMLLARGWVPAPNPRAARKLPTTQPS